MDSHLDPLPTKTVAKIIFNKPAPLKLKYIMFLSSKLNTNPQFPFEVCCAYTRVCVCVCALTETVLL